MTMWCWSMVIFLLPHKKCWFPTTILWMNHLPHFLSQKLLKWSDLSLIWDRAMKVPRRHESSRETMRKTHCPLPSRNCSIRSGRVRRRTVRTCKTWSSVSTKYSGCYLTASPKRLTLSIGLVISITVIPLPRHTKTWGRHTFLNLEKRHWRRRSTGERK